MLLLHSSTASVLGFGLIISAASSLSAEHHNVEGTQTFFKAASSLQNSKNKKTQNSSSFVRNEALLCGGQMSGGANQ